MDAANASGVTPTAMLAARKKTPPLASLQSAGWEVADWASACEALKVRRGAVAVGVVVLKSGFRERVVTTRSERGGWKKQERVHKPRRSVLSSLLQHLHLRQLNPLTPDPRPLPSG